LRTVLAICVIAFGLRVTAKAQAATGPCGTASSTSVDYTHVIWIAEENHSYGDIVGLSQAPYIDTVASEGGTSNDCATNTTDVGCHVATLVIGPSTPAGTQSATLFNHYSLLQTTEQLLGLPSLGQPAGSMAGAFGL
jgi:hypothetical protein